MRVLRPLQKASCCDRMNGVPGAAIPRDRFESVSRTDEAEIDEPAFRERTRAGVGPHFLIAANPCGSNLKPNTFAG
jgi:hypothetical protein